MASRRTANPKTVETEDIDTGILDEPETEPVERPTVEPEETAPSPAPMPGGIPDVGAGRVETYDTVRGGRRVRVTRNIDTGVKVVEPYPEGL